MVVLAFAPLSLFNISIFYLLGDSASGLSHRIPLGIILNSALPAFGAMQVIADADADADAPISKAGPVDVNAAEKCENELAQPERKFGGLLCHLDQIKLYTGKEDKTVWGVGIWDCQSAQIGCAKSLLWDIGGWTVVQPAEIVAAVEQLCQKNICTSGEV
ncbi:pyruvate dehydrogenase E1 beta [Actinidia rufa]|uniref:Pyruvate dehydrogenase E1 beta n=1 Tax=Actinidia rufa TaxID=165716 RepID=A0A7J0GNH6_9ERIC|nr:pyruvate dehydrogenase E1 beta [Actinidia rufa]